GLSYNPSKDSNMCETGAAEETRPKQSGCYKMEQPA
ncbi:unnamed protein product, partial [Tetraodon nigroviridis]